LASHPFQALQAFGKFGKFGSLICLHIAIDQFSDFSRVGWGNFASSDRGQNGRHDSRSILGSLDFGQ
jgi:hypothetical protein